MNYSTQSCGHNPVKAGAKHCSLCGGIYHNVAFKAGYICEECVDFIKGRT